MTLVGSCFRNVATISSVIKVEMSRTHSREIADHFSKIIVFLERLALIADQWRSAVIGRSNFFDCRRSTLLQFEAVTRQIFQKNSDMMAELRRSHARILFLSELTTHVIGRCASSSRMIPAHSLSRLVFWIYPWAKYCMMEGSCLRPGSRRPDFVITNYISRIMSSS